MTAGPREGPSELTSRWQSLTKPVGERLAAERVRDWAGGQVLVALDAAGSKHLLVSVPAPGVFRIPQPLVGLDIAVRELHPPGAGPATWIVLSATGPTGDGPFTGLAADVVAELPAAGAPDPAALFAVVERWRRFFGRTTDGLSHEEQVGLVGELWLLLEWLPAVTLATVTAWQGPLGGRHDWVTPRLSVEVKTTGSATGPVIHRVTSLDQLDEPGTGTLYLLSVRAAHDPSGTQSLDALITRARDAASLAGTTCAAALDDRLRAVGVTPAERGRYTDPLRIALAELYRVGPGFPRLTTASFPAGVPSGVVDIRYNLDMTACASHLVARAPTDTDELAAVSV